MDDTDYSYIQRTLRLDIRDWEEQYDALMRFFDVYKNSIRSAFAVVEIAKKTGKLHIQGIVEHIDQKDIYDSMRSFITRQIYKGNAPKGIYSFAAVKNYDEYMTYILKGREIALELNMINQLTTSDEPIVIYKKGYTDEVIASYRQNALHQQVQHLKKQSDIKTKRKVLTGATKCLAYLEEHRSSFIDDEGYLDQGRMAHIIISFFRNTSVVHDRIIFRKFYNLANNHFNPKGHTWDMLHDLRHEITLSKVLVSTGHPEYHSGHLHIRHADDGHFDELEKELISNEVLNNDE